MTTSEISIQTALISVSDREGLVPLCRELTESKVRLYATGGTAKYLSEQGIACDKIEDVTQFPEMMDGRVKTLHPKIFGGILARRQEADDIAAAKTHGIPLFDLVVVNLYPFKEHLGASVDKQVSYVDIGGPSLLRAASKNFSHVCVLSDPSDYEGFLNEWRSRRGSTGREFRLAQAAKTFSRTASYDAMITSQWRGTDLAPEVLALTPQISLRYGENPGQQAAYIGNPTWRVLQGKELSYNNLLDTDAAAQLVNEFSEPACAIIKHSNPCGAASGGGSLTELFKNALASDERSAFGGIVAVNRTLDATAAVEMAKLFLEVIVAPQFSQEALSILSQKKNLRLVEWPKPTVAPWQLRPALGGWLLQSADSSTSNPETWTTPTKSAASAELQRDLRFAWLVAKHVKSNAIVIAKNGRTLGVGAGQMSRIDSLEIALEKAGADNLNGAVLASDAFFPFRDSIDRLKGTGVKAIIQPGGSQKDPEVIAACDEHGIAMLFTGRRHFRH